MAITTQQMNLAMQSWQAMNPAEQEARKGQMHTMMTEYRQQQAEETNRIRNYFTRDDFGLEPEKLDALNATLAKTADPELSRMSLFNELLVSKLTGVPQGTFDGRKTSFMSAIAEKQWGHKGPIDERQFYNGMKSVYGMQDHMDDSAILAASEGVTSAKSWGQFKLDNADKPGWNPAYESEYAKRFFLRSSAQSDRVSQYRQVIDSIITEAERATSAMPSTTGKEVAKYDVLEVHRTGNDETGNLDKAADMLLSVPVEDRANVWDAVGRIAKAKGYDEKGLWQKIGETFGRRLESMGSGMPRTMLRAALGHVSRRMDEPGATVPKLWEGMSTEKVFHNLLVDADRVEREGSHKGQTLALDDDERSALKAMVEERRDLMDLQDEVLNFAHGQVDPIKRDNLFETSVLGITDTLPFIGAAMMPGGWLLNLGAYSQDNYTRLRVESPGMSRDDAQRIATLTAPIQALGDRIEGEFLLGALPAFNSLVQQVSGNALARFAGRWATAAVAETAIENAQDLAPFAMQEVVGALSQDVPDVPWKDVLGETFSAENQIGILAVTVPLSLIGAGVGRVRDIQAGRELIQDRTALQMIGIDDAAADEIRSLAAKGDIDGAEEKLRATFSSTDFTTPEVVARRESAIAENQVFTEQRESAVSQMEANGVLPAMRRTEQGWTLVFDDGSTSDFATHELADAARWQAASDYGFNIHQATREAFSQMERNAEAGREFAIDFSAEEMTAGRAIEQGLASREQILQRADIAETAGREESADYDNATATINAMSQSAEDALMASRILGSSQTEFREGIYRTTVRLYQGATPLTVIEEKLEGDAGVMIAQGKRDWMVSALRDYESKSGDKLFRTKDNAALTPQDIKEAWSHLGQSYFVGRTRKGGAVLGKKSVRKVFSDLMRSKLGGAMQAYTTFFRAVWRRAAGLNKMRREGSLSPDLERELAKGLGLEQIQHEQTVLHDAEQLAAEHREHLDNLEDGGAAFSMLPSNPERDERSLTAIQIPSQILQGQRADWRKQVRDYITQNLQGKTLVNADTGMSIRFNSESKSEAIAKLRKEQPFRTFASNIEKIVENSIKTSEQPPGKSRTTDTKMFHYFHVPVEIDGQVLDAWFNVREPLRGQPNEGLFYEFGLDLQNAVSPTLPGLGSASQDSQTNAPMPGSSIKVSDYLNFINGKTSGQTFALLPGELDTRLTAMFDPFQRSPELRQRLGVEMLRRVRAASNALRDNIALRAKEETRLESRVNDHAHGVKQDAANTDWKIAALRKRQEQDYIARELELETQAADLQAVLDTARQELKAAEQNKTIEVGGALADKASARRAVQLRERLEKELMAKRNRVNKASESLAIHQEQTKAELRRISDRHRLEREQLLRQGRSNARRNTEAVNIARDEASTRRNLERDNLIGYIRTLDAILAALPPEVRGKIGGYAKLAELVTDKSRLEWIESRGEKIDKVLETYLRKEADSAMRRLLKRAVPAKDGAGKKKVGKAGADIHALFDNLRDAMDMTADQVAGHVAGLEAQIASGNLTAEQEAHSRLEAELVSLMGNWREADAERRFSAVQEATGVWQSGYAAYRLRKLMEKEDRDIARQELRNDTGSIGARPEREAKMLEDNKLKGRWKDNLLGLLSFEQVAHYVFGADSREAARLVDMERAAAYRKEDAIQAATQATEDLFTRLAGGDRFQGEKLRWDLAQKSITVDGQPFSQLEAITVTLMWRQEDGRRHMDGKRNENGQVTSTWHYDQAFVDKVEAALSPEAIAVRSFIANEYAGEYARLNPIYRQLNGINLPQNSNYSPLTVKPVQAKANQTIDPVTGGTMSTGSPTPGALRTRGTAIAEPDFRDALQTYIAHTKQMEHWMAYAQFSTEAQALLANREVSNSVQATAGEQAVNVLHGWLDVFAQGGTRDAAAHLATNQMLSRMANRAASVALVGRIGTLAIQSTQLGAALAEMPAGAYAIRLSRLLAGRLNWTQAFQSEYIQRRLEEMPPVVRQAMDGLKASRPNRLKFHMAQVGRLLGGADALFTAGTYAIVYDYQMKQARDMGLQDMAAESFAREAAERSVDRIAQPTRAGARSLFENRATNPFYKLAWAFASESRKNLGLLTYAFAKGDASQKARTIAYVILINSIMASIIRSAWKDARDDEDEEIFDERNWSLKRIALNAATDWTTGLPVIGEMIQAGAFKLAGEWQPEGGLFSTFSGAAPAVKRLPDLFTGELDADQALKDIESILSAMGLANDSMAAAASLSHLVRDLYGVADNIEGRD